MPVLDGFLNLLHLLCTVFVAVLLHCLAFFLLEGFDPDFDIVELLVLSDLEGLTLFTKKVCIEGHDLVVVKLFFFLQVHDLVSLYLLDALGLEFLEYFACTVLSLSVQLLKQLVAVHLLLVLELL